MVLNLSHKIEWYGHFLKEGRKEWKKGGKGGRKEREEKIKERNWYLGPTRDSNVIGLCAAQKADILAKVENH